MDSDSFSQFFHCFTVRLLLSIHRYPSKHETFNQCWLSVGPASKTMGQHLANIDSTSRVAGLSERLTKLYLINETFSCKGESLHA